MIIDPQIFNQEVRNVIRFDDSSRKFRRQTPEVAAVAFVYLEVSAAHNEVGVVKTGCRIEKRSCSAHVDAHERFHFRKNRSQNISDALMLGFGIALQLVVVTTLRSDMGAPDGEHPSDDCTK